METRGDAALLTIRVWNLAVDLIPRGGVSSRLKG
jgi:hypothetical protein